MSFQLDFVKSIFFSVQFQLICQSKCFVLPFSHVSSLDLEHRFCGKMSESEITNMHIDFGLNSKIFHKWGVDFKWDSPLSQNFLLFPLFFRGSEVPHVVLVLSFEKAWWKLLQSLLCYCRWIWKCNLCLQVSTPVCRCCNYNVPVNTAKHNCVPVPV